MTERWAAVNGFPYEVSSLGAVRRVGPSPRTGPAPGRALRPWARRGGYASVKLHGSGGAKVTRRVHVLVSAAFLGPRPDGMVINHKNSDRLDNRVWNLEYVTPADNVKHAFLCGRGRRGSRHQNSKLTEESVVEMHRLRAAGATLYDLGKRFGVSYSLAGMVCRGDLWTHVPKPGATRLRDVG